MESVQHADHMAITVTGFTITPASPYLAPVDVHIPAASLKERDRLFVRTVPEVV